MNLNFWNGDSGSGDTAATYKLSDTFLEYNAIFDERYATAIGELYAGTATTLDTKVTSIHYQTLLKRHYLED